MYRQFFGITGCEGVGLSYGDLKNIHVLRSHNDYILHLYTVMLFFFFYYQ